MTICRLKFASSMTFPSIFYEKKLDSTCFNNLTIEKKWQLVILSTCDLWKKNILYLVLI